MANTVKNTIKSRKIGFILASGADGGPLNDLKTQLEEGARVELIAPNLAGIRS
jgi:catalase